MPNTTGIDPLTGKQQAAPAAAPSWQAPDADLTAWDSVSSDIGGTLQTLGLSSEDAYKQWVSAGKPRGAAARAWKASLASPQNALKDMPEVAPSQSGIDQVLKASGLNQGMGADQVAGIAQPDPVQQALAALQGSDTSSAAAQQQALQGAQSAGQGNAAQQQALIKQLQAQAAGGGPSAALALFQLALGKNINAQASAAAGVRGGNAAAAARNAGIQGSAMGAEAQQGAAAIRAQEQQAATAQLSGTLQGARQQDLEHAASVADIAAQVRGQDVGKATTYAGLVQAASALEESKKQAQVGTALSLLQTDLGAQSTNLQALLQKAGLGVNYDLGQGSLELQRQQLRDQREAASRAFAMQLLGTVFGAGSSALGGVAGAAGAAGGAEAVATPTANTADYLARARAHGWGG